MPDLQNTSLYTWCMHTLWYTLYALYTLNTLYILLCKLYTKHIIISFFGLCYLKFASKINFSQLSKHLTCFKRSRYIVTSQKVTIAQNFYVCICVCVCEYLCVEWSSVTSSWSIFAMHDSPEKKHQPHRKKWLRINWVNDTAWN